MFAVPGWSVKSESLKAETARPKAGGGEGGNKPSKRKRQGGQQGGTVTSENVADMWEKVVAGNEPRSKRQRKNKKEKEKEKGSKAEGNKESSKGQQLEEPKQPKKERKDKKDKDKKKKKKRAKDRNDDEPEELEPSNPDADAELPPLPPAEKLTPFQKAMRSKLIPARFRHLNETLYTRPSEEAFKLFQDSPELFDEYHAGFRQQVEVWPENPVDGYIAAIRLRAAASQPRTRDFLNSKDKCNRRHEQKATTGNSSVVPLPTTKGICTIADLGCGDARLATVLNPEKKKLNLIVKSFDLHSPSTFVAKADIANLPLEDGSINVAIFCLALMGTNWLSFIEEAYRILHWKGELWIAEIKSRFGRVTNKAANIPVPHSVGNRKKAAIKRAIARDANEPADLGKDLEVEVDGQDDRRHETDVSAFVEALRKRGFVLRERGEKGDRDAVDLSNKMFVKMYFVKAATPTVGKGAKEERLKPRKKAWAADDEEDDVDESTILKPCVYKLR